MRLLQSWVITLHADCCFWLHAMYYLDPLFKKCSNSSNFNIVIIIRLERQYALAICIIVWRSSLPYYYMARASFIIIYLARAVCIIILHNTTQDYDIRLFLTIYYHPHLHSVLLLHSRWGNPQQLSRTSSGTGSTIPHSNPKRLFLFLFLILHVYFFCSSLRSSNMALGSFRSFSCSCWIIKSLSSSASALEGR